MQCMNYLMQYLLRLTDSHSAFSLSLGRTSSFCIILKNSISATTSCMHYTTFTTRFHQICVQLLSVASPPLKRSEALFSLFFFHLSIVCFIPFRKLRGVFVGDNPSSLWTSQQLITEGVNHTSEQFGVQYLAQGHFNMQLSSARSRDLNQRSSDH